MTEAESRPIEGCVFSIEEFATFDGPGIRTTVFLKGCPLRCMWCHNPEGQRSERQLVRSPNGCLGCEQCLDTGERLTGQRQLVPASIDVCPRNLIRFSGVVYTPQTLAAKLSKNLRLLNPSGGGITFSGGEPLAQPRFVIETMRLLYGKTSLALQTCGYTSVEVFTEALTLADYVLYDLKLLDTDRHRHYTGVGNETILDNYRRLVRSGVSFVTRVPLIPTVTDTVENLTAIAAFLKENGVTSVELLPYNAMAGSKYPLAGMTWAPDYDESVPSQPHIEIFEAHGITARIL